MPAPHPSIESAHHLLVPFAAASAPECRAALSTLVLPQLGALLGELMLEHTDTGDDHSLSPPHERALAMALGLTQANGQPYGDGLIPWAAARSDDPTTPQAWFSPCHFAVATHQVNLQPGAEIDLTDGESRALFDALAPYCAEDGITLCYGSALRWHASGEALRDLACASLDRVSARSVADWTPADQPNLAGSHLLKRLQSEAQMLFYTHPVNDGREAARKPIVNGFWVEGAGARDAFTPLRPDPVMPDGPRLAALRADWPAWQQAWTRLDAEAIPVLLARVRRGEPVVLTLCGERHAQRWVNAPRTLGARLGRTLKQLTGPQPAWKILEAL
jgi:hypothetical protein